MTTSIREEITVGAMKIRFLVDGEESGGSVAMFEFDVPAGWKVAAVEIGPGETLHIPRGAVHQFDNDHAADATALAVVTPGILGPAYFREVAAVLDAAGDGPPDFAALGAVMRRHGLTCAE